MLLLENPGRRNVADVAEDAAQGPNVAVGVHCAVREVSGLMYATDSAFLASASIVFTCVPAEGGTKRQVHLSTSV